MKDRLRQQAKREYSPNQRLAALAGAAVVFIGILPLGLVLLGRRRRAVCIWDVAGLLREVGLLPEL